MLGLVIPKENTERKDSTELENFPEEVSNE